MLRIDVLTAEGQSTQYYGAASIYAITPTTEDTARRAATLSTVAPINRWELPAPPDRTAPDDMVGYENHEQQDDPFGNI